MERREFLKTAGAAAAAATAVPGVLSSTMLAGTAPTSGKKPNIMFILADDLGIGDVSCYGADNYKTPNIDKLAAEGTRYNHFYISPLCGPSRALVLTGRYAFRTGASNQQSTGQMKPSVEKFQPAYLKPAGYKTIMCGKWGQLPTGEGLGPAAFGFDEYLHFQGSGVYWNYQVHGKTYEKNGKTIDLKDHEYMPDVMHDYLVDFITRHQDVPFYAYYALSHIHAQILPTPDSREEPKKDYYYDNILYMDKEVGKIVAVLEKLKLRENTLIVFVGDNGTAKPHADSSTIGGKRLSGHKGTMLEGGALVPFIVNWPGHTPAGKVSNEMMSAADFVPTFAEFAGGTIPSSIKIDGHSFVSQIYGRKPAQPRENIFVQLNANWYAREEMFKMDQDGTMFDMSQAPFAEPTIDKNSKNPDHVAARARLQTTLAQLDPAHGIPDSGHPWQPGNGKRKRKNQAAPPDNDSTT